MPNVIPSSDIDDGEISPGTRPDYVGHVVEPKPYHRLSTGTEYTLSQKSLSSTDSSVPRRLVRAIPDLRMFKFVKKRNHERKIEEQKRLELEAENARLDREAEEKKRKTQFQISTTAKSSTNRPGFIRLPDKPKMVRASHEILQPSTARSPFKDITGFFKAFGDKSKKESSQSSQHSSSRQRRNSSKSNISRSTAILRTSISVNNPTPLTREPSDFSNIHNERQSGGTLIRSHAEESKSSGTGLHSPRPKLVRMSITPFRRQTNEEEGDENDVFSTARNSAPSAHTPCSGTEVAYFEKVPSSTNNSHLSPRSLASPVPSPGCAAERSGFETTVSSTSGYFTKKSRASSTLKQSDPSIARKRRYFSEPGTPEGRSVHSSIRKAGVRSEEDMSAPTTPLFEEQERDTSPVANPDYVSPASAGLPPPMKRRRGKFRGYFFEHSTPDGSDDSSPVLMPWEPFWQKSTYGAATAIAPNARRSSVHKDWYNVRLDNILDDGPDLGDARAVQDIPDHLPGSPLCPREPKHSSGGTGVCPVHGKRSNLRKYRAGFV
jgi:hypothetical protein